MRIIPFILLLSVSAFPQCDANEDGNLDILDIIDQVNCILDGCWGSDQETSEIYDYWMLDSMYAEISLGGFPIQSFSIACEDEDTTTVMHFNQDGFVYQYPIDSDYCGDSDVYLPDTSIIQPFSTNGDTISISTLNDYGETEVLAMVYSIQGDNMTLSNNQSFDDIMPGAVGTTVVYLHRVSTLNNQVISRRNLKRNLYQGHLHTDTTDKLFLDLFQETFK